MDSIFLDDAQIRSFIQKGYLLLHPTSVPDEFHDKMYEQAADMFGDEIVNGLHCETNPGNNILPKMPELRHIFQDPTIMGALMSILGPDYMLHPHRHCHQSVKGRKAQRTHQDSYWGHRQMQHHRPRWAMLMYYPQDTTLEMGPTGVFPGTQYFKEDPEDISHTGWDSLELSMTCKAGDVLLIHYDIWHRGLRNDSDELRFMFKFQFTRMHEPTSPSWICTDKIWDLSAEESLNAPVWTDVWNWMIGSPDQKITEEKRDDALLIDLQEKLLSDSDPIRVSASYQLGNLGIEGVEVLLKCLQDSQYSTSLQAKTIAYGLIASGECAIKKLCSLIEEKSEFAPIICFVLGSIRATPQTVRALLKGTKIEDSETRLEACQALGRCLNGIENEKQLLGEVGETLAGVLGGTAEYYMPMGHPSSKPKIALPQVVQPSMHERRQSDSMADSDLAYLNNNQVRACAMLSLAQLGPSVSTQARTIATFVDDEDRYVGAYAVEALWRIATKESKELAFNALSAQRWCRFTSNLDPF